MTTPRESELERLLQLVWDLDATDLLLTVGAAPWLRIDGQLRRLETEPAVEPKLVERVVKDLLSPAQREQLAERGDADFSFDWKGQSRFRGNVFRQKGHLALAIRSIPYAIPSLEDLGVPDVVRQLIEVPRGLVLVTGPTGSGKSTTLASIVDRINETQRLHVITIEDPVEYVHEHKLCAVEQREVGDDTPSFATALRSALREDPDVLLVGEMRDLESIRIALTVAETGHLVLASLHTNDTAQAVDRIVDVFDAAQQQQIRVQLAGSLTAIVHQRLLPRTDGGLVAAFEVLVATSAVRNLIREGRSSQLRNLLVTGQRQGMQTLEESLGWLVREGVTTYDEAVARSQYPKEIVCA